MKQIFSVLLLLFIFTVSKMEGQVLPFTFYTPDSEINPLPSAEVLKVTQDRMGYIWMAVYSSGMVRYNSVKMEVFDTDDGLRDLTVWDMIEDSTGRLWVSSNAGLVATELPLHAYPAGEKINFVSEFDDIPLVDVAVNYNRMSVDKDGWLWIGTETLGIVRYRFDRDGALESDTLSTDLSDTGNEISVRSLLSRRNGSVWVSLRGGNFLNFFPGKETVQYDSGSEINTNSLFESMDGTLWGGRQNGQIWKLEERDDEVLEFVEVNSKLESNIPDISSASDQTIWVSSEGSGLQVINPEDNSTRSFYTRTNGLLGDIIYNVFEDRERNIWIAQSGGVSKLRYNFRAFQNITASSFAGETPVLPSPSINGLLPSDRESDPCALWAGTSEGGLACIDDNFLSEVISDQDGLTSNWVNGMSYDHAGRLWIGTSRGMNSLTFGNTKPVTGAEGSENVSIFGRSAVLSTYPSSSVLAVNKLLMPVNSEAGKWVESIWFPAYRAVNILVNDKLYKLDSESGLPAVIYHAAAFDEKGHLWAGTRDRGIYRSTVPITPGVLEDVKNNELEGSLFEIWWSTENGAPSNQIENLLWHEDNMWTGTPAGLISFEGDSNEIRYHIKTAQGLLANNATSVAASPITGSIWVGTNQGLAEIDPDSGTVLQTVTKTSGLVDNDTWFYGSLQADMRGMIYLGTAKGISIYNPLLDSENMLPPVIRLENAVSEEIPGERNEFSFEYAALSFGNERSVRYQTRLIGFNDEWSPDKTDVRVNYTNLPAYFFPKTYTFEARAVNDSGFWSEDNLSYSFSVVPAWWVSWWAFAGYFLIFGAGVFYIDRVQRARLIKKEREAALLRETELKAETALEKSRVAEAQAKALKAENELKATELEKAKELEKAYHDLKATQSRLIQAEKMASLGRMSTGIAHEIKNPLNFINNFAELSKDLVDDLKSAVEKNDTEELSYILNSLRFNTQKIEEHGKRADSIVKSMMQHSRLDRAGFETVKLNDLVKKYADLAYHGKKTAKKDLDVSFLMNFDSSIKETKLIPQKIGQVLQNVIENAIDSVCEYSKECNGEYKPVIELVTKKTDSQVEIRISDNGPGIPDEILENIFEPFFTTKPTGEGTGLGLSLSYDIITQMHSGKIEAGKSALGGAMFSIKLPLTEA